MASEQGFWLQGYVPMEWLYWYHELGYQPQSDIITGPIMVDNENIDKFDPLSKAVFGTGSEDNSAWRCYGHDERWWREFCYRLRMVGYDGWLSIEHEDVMLSRMEGARRSVQLLNAVTPIEVSDFTPQQI